jgi:hypothetical protein
VEDPRLREVLIDIVEGKTVKRSKHELRWEKRDVTAELTDALRGKKPERRLGNPDTG